MSICQTMYSGIHICTYIKESRPDVLCGKDCDQAEYVRGIKTLYIGVIGRDPGTSGRRIELWRDGVLFSSYDVPRKYYDIYAYFYNTDRSSLLTGVYEARYVKNGSVQLRRTTQISLPVSEIMCYQPISYSWSGQEIRRDCNGKAILHSVKTEGNLVVGEKIKILVKWWYTENEGFDLLIPNPKLVIDDILYEKPEVKSTTYMNPGKQPPVVYEHIFSEPGEHVIEMFPNPNDLPRLVINIGERVVCAESTKRGEETCYDGSVIHKEVCRGNTWVPTGAICPTKPKPECTDGDKKPGHVCRGGKWVPIEEEPAPSEEVRYYLKFDIPWLDLLPGIPYEAWMPVLPGFKLTEEP